MARSRRLTVLAGRLHGAFSEVPEAPLVVALSGGADSAAAAWAAVDSGRQVRAIHVHHGLAASDSLADAARGVAGSLGIVLDVVAVEVPPGSSPEGRARAVRYEALAGAGRPGELIVTAHTADDQAETVLGHVLRGSGFDGLAGIPPLRPPYVRPLLGVTRSETRELATLAGLPWRDDPANEDLGLVRNLLRRRIIPWLEAEVAVGLRPSLVRSAAIVRSEVAVLADLADRVVVHRVAAGFGIAAGELAAVGPAVAARAIRAALAEYRPPHPPDRDEVAAILAVAAGSGPRDLGGGWRVSRVGASVVVTPRGSSPVLVPDPVVARFPGVVRWGGFRIDLIVTGRPPVVPLSRWAVVLPVDPGTDEIVVRSSTPGDRIAVAGGHKRVADALAEAAIQREDRRRWPVVEVAGEIVWIPGVRRLSWQSGDRDRYLCAVATVDELDDRGRPVDGEESRWKPFAR